MDKSTHSSRTMHRLPIGARIDYSDNFIKVDSSLKHGKGLFATSMLARGFMIGPYMGHQLNEEEADLEQRLGNRYLFEIGTDCIIDGRDKTISNVMRYMNAADVADEQNCEFSVIDGEVAVRALRDIPKDQELLGHYCQDTDSQIVPSCVIRKHIMIKNLEDAVYLAEIARRHFEELASDLGQKYETAQMEILRLNGILLNRLKDKTRCGRKRKAIAISLKPEDRIKSESLPVIDHSDMTKLLQEAKKE